MFYIHFQQKSTWEVSNLQGKRGIFQSRAIIRRERGGADE